MYNVIQFMRKFLNSFPFILFLYALIDVITKAALSTQLF